RRRVCQHLSAGGGGDRPAIPLLPSRLLQRHLFPGASGRTARPRDPGICGRGARRRRGGRGSADRDLSGDDATAAALAGIERAWTMTRLPALALTLASFANAASLPQEIDRALVATAAARTAFWGIQVVALESGKTLYRWNADHFFVPASNTKLFTTAMALSR